jgi:hypothetical protein
MKDDPRLSRLPIVENAWHDEQKQLVYLCGKIGETAKWQQRVKNYKCNANGMLSDVLLIILKFFVSRRSTEGSIQFFQRTRNGV